MLVDRAEAVVAAAVAVLVEAVEAPSEAVEAVAAVRSEAAEGAAVRSAEAIAVGEAVRSAGVDSSVFV